MLEIIQVARTLTDLPCSIAKKAAADDDDDDSEDE